MNMIRNLLGLVIILALLPICILAFRFTSNMPFEYSEICDELSLAQLRETMLITYDLHYGYDCLSFTYRNKDFTLSMVNNKLLLQPGTQVYLGDIDDLHFEERNGCIYVCYERKNRKYERIIASSQGVYLDDFSDCDVHDDELDSSEE
ncbi:MAG: hypothetical protein IK151_05340 [Erysipelotrichaceae bacterium]|nr:hypothetical protein [Erysipelotrichaceae bacterium]